MKNTLILSLLLGLTPLAAAQAATPTPPPAAQPATPADPNAQPTPVDPNATPVDPNAAPATPVDPNAAPATPVDPNAAPATPVDPNAAPATPVDPNAAPATPVDPNATPVDPNAVPATTTQTPPIPDAPAGADVPESLTPAQSFARAQELAAQAEVAYPAAFVDRTLWKAAVTDAANAAAAEPTNRDYASYAAQLYTKTQWWINAYNAWSRLGELTDAEKDLASLAAAKLGYLALQRGDTAAAQTYITQGIAYRDTQSLQDLQKRIGQ